MNPMPDPLPTAGEPGFENYNGLTDEGWDAKGRPIVTSKQREVEPTAGEPTLAEVCATVREALAKATPGPWKAPTPRPDRHDELTRTIWVDLPYMGRIESTPVAQAMSCHDVPEEEGFIQEQALYNAALIASAPTWLARLVDGVREMEAQVERMAHQWRLANERANALDSEVTALQSKLESSETERRKSEDEALHWQDSYVALQSKLADAENQRGAAQRGFLEAHAMLRETAGICEPCICAPCREYRAALTPPAGHATHQEEGAE